MPVRGNVFQKGNYYHIYNRGKKLFHTRENYDHCIYLLKKYAKKFDITLFAYCLMPNHYHLLVKQDAEISISKWISVVFNQFAQKSNRQKNQLGPIFESRFKHILIETDEYLLQLCRYIHLNPVKAELVKRPEDWLGSDYLVWVNGTNKILETYFSGINDYADFVNGCDENTIPRRYLF